MEYFNIACKVIVMLVWLLAAIMLVRNKLDMGFMSKHWAGRWLTAAMIVGILFMECKQWYLGT